ncbi:22682_t:CDS:2 [Dentiscutata erythropus]|uniref:22682_t:CDS:1 n=1 Tax=Dentiscutata erythropus TaxID=1348616 RepID=A0A9N9GP73_9GLOM|nr:22682_t:CDS:2 [Dentiscutata erythropus]
MNEELEDFLVIRKKTEGSYFMSEKSNDHVMHKEAMNSFDSEFESDVLGSHDNTSFQTEIGPSSLFSGKEFDTWEECELFLNKLVKNRGFHLVKDHICRENGVLHRRTYLYDHGGFYESNTEKDTNTKKT